MNESSHGQKMGFCWSWKAVTVIFFTMLQRRSDMTRSFLSESLRGSREENQLEGFSPKRRWRMNNSSTRLPREGLLWRVRLKSRILLCDVRYGEEYRRCVPARFHDLQTRRALRRSLRALSGFGTSIWSSVNVGNRRPEYESPETNMGSTRGKRMMRRIS